MPYVLERKFRLTTYKDDDDFSTLEDDSKANGYGDLIESQMLSAYINRYYVRFKTTDSGKPRIFILVLDLIIGC
jgi:hypothetical protein